jgi:hypothetical protein
VPHKIQAYLFFMLDCMGGQKAVSCLPAVGKVLAKHEKTTYSYQVRYMHVLIMSPGKVYEGVKSCKGGKRFPDAIIGTLTENLTSPKVARIGH